MKGRRVELENYMNQRKRTRLAQAHSQQHEPTKSSGTNSNNSPLANELHSELATQTQLLLSRTVETQSTVVIATITIV